MNIDVSLRNLQFLECFSSETRIRIIELLNERSMNIKELAERLSISSAIVTKHIQRLEEAGIVESQNVAGIRGMQKMCSLRLEQALLQFKTKKAESAKQHRVSLPVGHYSSHHVKPTCGLASPDSIIGMMDDPRYFADPNRMKAAHLWFGSGYVEYQVPNYLVGGQTLKEFEIGLEICSEAPGFNENWPSDITFTLNGLELGTWTCPGDFGAKRGAHTPEWWDNGTQYGLWKTVTVREDGTYLDGLRLSDVTTADLGTRFGESFIFRIASEEVSHHRGGISLFGRGFGNYDRDIEVRILFE